MRLYVLFLEHWEEKIHCLKVSMGIEKNFLLFVPKKWGNH
jgi:hypothetical protein